MDCDTWACTIYSQGNSPGTTSAPCAQSNTVNRMIKSRWNSPSNVSFTSRNRPWLSESDCLSMRLSVSRLSVVLVSELILDPLTGWLVFCCQCSLSESVNCFSLSLARFVPFTFSRSLHLLSPWGTCAICQCFSRPLLYIYIYIYMHASFALCCLVVTWSFVYLVNVFFEMKGILFWSKLSAGIEARWQQRHCYRPEFVCVCTCVCASAQELKSTDFGNGFRDYACPCSLALLSQIECDRRTHKHKYIHTSVNSTYMCQ